MLLVVVMTLILPLGIVAGIVFLFYRYWKSRENSELGVGLAEQARKEKNNGVSRMTALKRNASVKSAIIFGLTLVLIIPLMFVKGIVSERESLYRGVLKDIADSWGQQQVVIGPMLAVPYWVTVRKAHNENGKRHITEEEVQKTAYFLPDIYDFKLSMSPEHRYRGIYQALVYEADVDFAARFSGIVVEDENIKRVGWDKASMVFSITDVSAIESVSVTLNGEKQEVEPGGNSQVVQGFHFSGDMHHLEDNSFEVIAKLRLRGSDEIKVAPVGSSSRIELEGSWPHPSFIGNILPVSRDIAKEGFSAVWQIPKIARGYPQSWTSHEKSYVDNYVNKTLVGVSLSEPVHLYSIVERAVKYGILFIGLTFMTLLIFELTIKKSLHLLQYGLVGLSMTLFYLTLLSLAEHMKFSLAYAIASVVAIAMITGYVAGILKQAKPVLIEFSVLVGLYTVLYSILHMEDFALLMGTALLLIVTAGLMYATRNLDQLEE